MKTRFENRDCMEVMKEYPDNYFDLAVVDPPYGIGDINQTISKKLHKDINWNDAIPTQEYFTELHRVSANQIIWGINYYADYVKSTGRLIHDKVHNSGAQLKELSDADIASHSFGVNIKMFKYAWRGNVQGKTINWDNTGPDARIHPTQKPISLYSWIYKSYTKEGMKILDTHLGSGSNAIAAHYSGMGEFVGCEIDEYYFTSFLNRFKEQTKQLKLV